MTIDVAALDSGDHLCLSRLRPVDRVAMLADFTAGGLERRQKVRLETTEPAATVLAQLTDRLPQAANAVGHGQLDVIELRQDAPFCADEALETLAAARTQARREGFTGLRYVEDRTWLGHDLAYSGALADYERRVNRLYVHGDLLGICLYRPERLYRRAWRSILTAHPCSAAADADVATASLRCVRTSPGTLQLTGAMDHTNHGAVPHLLAGVSDARVHHLSIDAIGLRFADVAGVYALLAVVRLRGRRPTTIVCSAHLAMLLRLMAHPDASSLRVTVNGDHHQP